MYTTKGSCGTCLGLSISCSSPLLQPFQHWEHPETKRLLHNLLLVSTQYEKLIHLRNIEAASEDTIALIHTPEYIKDVRTKSGRMEGGYADEETTFSQYAFDIASLAVGGTIYAVDNVMQKEINSPYVLCRPPGHHALPDKGMGFCIFNNIAIATKYLMRNYSNEIKKVAIVDYDVHHGNGTQNAFYDDPNVLFISIHQDSNFPTNSGIADENEIGGQGAEGSIINIPLPPGSGSGAYKCAIDTIGIPSLQAFRADFMLVSSGFDASYADPLSAMKLSSQDFRSLASLVKFSEQCHSCQGRIVFVHEGGYSESYAPFCGAAVIEEMLGLKYPQDCIQDPFLSEVQNWGGHELQEHQRKAVDDVAVLHGLSKSTKM